MSIEHKLAAAIEKLRSHPQLIGIKTDLTNPNQTGAMGDTMLHFAVETGTLEDVEVLIAAGANVNAIGDIGNTPLHSAAMMGKSSIAKKLLERGADPKLRNEFGQSAVDVARIGGHNELAEVLRTYRTGASSTGQGRKRD